MAIKAYRADDNLNLQIHHFTHTPAAMKQIDFYFDYSSPYAYLASEQIEAIAARHDAKVNWIPILLGVVFKSSNSAPLTMQYAPRAQYSVHDFNRSARFAKIPYTQPNPFPISGVAISRASYWIKAKAPDKLDAFVHAGLRALFVHNQDITKPEVIGPLAAGIGVNAEAMLTGMLAEEIKNQLKTETEAAINMGIFGAPFMVVDGEMFWGNDRLPQLEHWLATGGF
jgi:2-hydroxychromene-2-carboxylate isomerase